MIESNKKNNVLFIYYKNIGANIVKRRKENNSIFKFLGGILRNMNDNKQIFKLLSFLCQKRDGEYFFYIPYITDYYQAKGIQKASS